MKFAARDRRRRPAINITPLIDVLFLLVIFVLVTAQFEDLGGISVELPRGKSDELPEVQTLTLVLTSEGKFFLDKEELALPDLGPRLKKALPRARSSVLVVKADRSVPWERVMLAIDTAKNIGLKQVAFQIRH